MDLGVGGRLLVKLHGNKNNVVLKQILITKVFQIKTICVREGKSKMDILNIRGIRFSLILILFNLFSVSIFQSKCFTQKNDVCWKEYKDRWEGKLCNIPNAPPQFFYLKNLVYLWEGDFIEKHIPQDTKNIDVYFDSSNILTNAKLLIFEPINPYRMITKKGKLDGSIGKYSWSRNILKELQIRTIDLFGYVKIDSLSATHFVVAPIIKFKVKRDYRPKGFEITFHTLKDMYIEYEVGFKNDFKIQSTFIDTILESKLGNPDHVNGGRDIKIKILAENDMLEKGIYLIKLFRTLILTNYQLKDIDSWLIKIIVQ